MVLVATQVKRRRGTTAENDAFTGAEGEITVDTEKHQLRVHDGETQGGFVIGSGGSGRNIGDIFYTTRTDTALAGAVECNGGTYNTEDYEGDGSIGELLEAGKLDYISLTAYATAISTKGWCDKIGWNGTGTTSFRVPTLTPHIVQKNNIPVVGNGMALGLTDGTKNAGLMYNTNTRVSAFTGCYGSSVGTTYSGSSPSSEKSVGITTDGTKSGIIADTSDTAQLRVMFQLFNGTTDEAVATVGTVVAQVGELNSHRVIDFQIPTAGNGYTWYRKYADGWVEQGGYVEATTSPADISLPIAMANTNYCANMTPASNASQSSPRVAILKSALTATNIKLYFYSYTSGEQKAYWEVKGMAK